MPPSDDEVLAALVRRFRQLQADIEARSQRAIGAGDFGITDAAWWRWMRENPPTPRPGQQRLFDLPGAPGGRIPLGTMTRESRQWKQLKLALDENQLRLWSEQSALVAEAAQRQVALATSMYLQQYTTTARGTPLRPVPVAPHTVTTEALRGVTAVELWSRPLTTLRVALFEGKPAAEARRLARLRASEILGTNLQLSHVRTAVNYMRERGERDNIVGYRRVPRGSHSCALCLLASTQRYHRGDLMPIHHHCHCVVQPIYGDRDPGQVIEPGRLSDLHAVIADATGSADLSGGHYRDAVVIHLHGEIGPVLTYRDHSFTGPSDLKTG